MKDKIIPVNFKKWFKAQFGGLPLNPDDALEKYKEIWKKEAVIRNLKHEMAENETLNAQWRAILYAQNVKKWDNEP